MIQRLGVLVGSRRPGRPVGGEAGAVTVEAALALLGMTVVLGAVAWAVGLLGAQLALGEAARAAARVAARAESSADTVAEATRLVPDAQVDLGTDGEHVVVELRRSVHAPGLLARWGAVELVARAVAATEAP